MDHSLVDALFHRADAAAWATRCRALRLLAASPTLIPNNGPTGVLGTLIHALVVPTSAAAVVSAPARWTYDHWTFEAAADDLRKSEHGRT